MKIKRAFRLYINKDAQTHVAIEQRENVGLTVQPKPINRRMVRNRGLHFSVLEEIFEDVFEAIKAAAIKFLAKGVKINIIINFWLFECIYRFHCCHQPILYLGLKSFYDLLKIISNVLLNKNIMIDVFCKNLFK